MRILALDAASDRLLIGVADENGSIADFTGEPDRSHSEKLIATLDSLLGEADIAATDLDMLAVTTGPGSFTGLRVGIATALGLAQAWHKEILAIGNMRLARLFFDERRIDPVVVTHCRGEEFYAAVSGEGVEILSATALFEKYLDRQFGGFGADRLNEIAIKQGVKLQLTSPTMWRGGELAALVVKYSGKFERLNPINLDVNYVLKSQPEQKRDALLEIIKVVDMQREDLDDVVRIEREAFSDPWDEENFVADIENEHVIVLAARSGNNCVGYLSCIALDDYGYVANVAVEGEFRSKGVGKALMDDLRRRLLARDIHDIVLDVRVSNSRAIMFYERYGFSVITRRKGFYTTPPEDSFTMLKSLEE
ncbi:MAG: ribosomal protein S18-alanine N-acetyltransferase [Candidatus Zixiibacteriota bacterium]